jgi:hypothetical protein
MTPRQETLHYNHGLVLFQPKTTFDINQGFYSREYVHILPSDEQTRSKNKIFGVLGPLCSAGVHRPLDLLKHLIKGHQHSSLPYFEVLVGGPRTLPLPYPAKFLAAILR